MSVINPVSTTPIFPMRPTEDFGEETFTNLPEIPAVVSLTSDEVSDRKSRFIIRGKVFVPTASDIQPNDKFEYQGYFFRVVGWVGGGQAHPFTGDWFGWIGFDVEAVG